VADHFSIPFSALGTLDGKIGLLALYGLGLALIALLVLLLKSVKALQREVNEVAWLCSQVLDGISLSFPTPQGMKREENLISDIEHTIATPSAVPEEKEEVGLEEEDSSPFQEVLEKKPIKRLFIWIASKGCHPSGPFATGVIIKNSDGEVVERFGSKTPFPKKETAVMQALTESLRRASASGAKEVVIFLSGPGAKFAANVLKREEPNEQVEGELLQLRKEFDKFELVLMDRKSNRNAEAIALKSLGELGDHSRSLVHGMGQSLMVQRKAGGPL
jgi:hypothetical protein